MPHKKAIKSSCFFFLSNILYCLLYMYIHFPHSHILLRRLNSERCQNLYIHENHTSIHMQKNGRFPVNLLWWWRSEMVFFESMCFCNYFLWKIHRERETTTTWEQIWKMILCVDQEFCTEKINPNIYVLHQSWVCMVWPFQQKHNTPKCFWQFNLLALFVEFSSYPVFLL